MGHAVMTHTQNQPGEVHLDALPHTIQDAFDALMDQADQAADHRDLTAYALLHDQATRLIGIRPPASGELARCTCQSCYCTAVFDANKARCYMDGPIEFVQCETCADEHRLTGDE
ncbi:hypothetical protein E6R18_32825 [Streptomyces sp. A1277]|uniref:hypothetical protein n=1 Tax=Streptomyces sp. A1277 TaxID=2563103 RepID=UPI0010A2374B|nr:hypothetical protein [Streptomyces sp. A1277]THA22732.1 hypothetical protein E6R18_32825 [Streptomyces sp. A1277]